MKEKYVIENKFAEMQLRYAEQLLDKEFTDLERQIFEWAYIQGKEDAKEGLG